MPLSDKFLKAMETAEPYWQEAQKRIARGTESTASSLGKSAGMAAQRYKNFFGATGKMARGAYSPVSKFGNRLSKVGESMVNTRTGSFGGVVGYNTARFSRLAGKMTRGVGNRLANPKTTFGRAIKATSKGAVKAPGKFIGAAKASRRMYKSIPKPVRKMGLVGGLALGATAMLGVSVLKGAMDTGKQIAYQRYMQDQAISRDVLTSTRLGNSSGTNRMLGYGGTVGLSNALSATRHGRY